MPFIKYCVIIAKSFPQGVPNLHELIPYIEYLESQLGRVVQKAVSANPGLKFNRLFILVCCASQLKLKFSQAKHFIVSMISEHKFSNIFVYIFIILSTKFPLILD